MKFKSKLTGLLLKTNNKEVIEQMTKSDLFEEIKEDKTFDGVVESKSKAKK